MIDVSRDEAKQMITDLLTDRANFVNAKGMREYLRAFVEGEDSVANTLSFVQASATVDPELFHEVFTHAFHLAHGVCQLAALEAQED